VLREQLPGSGDVPAHRRPSRLASAVAQRYKDGVVIVGRGRRPTRHRGEEFSRGIARRRAEQPADLGGAGQPEDGAVELEVQLLYPVVVPVLGRGTQTGLQGLQSLDIRRGCCEGSPGRELPGQQRPRFKGVPNVLSRQR